MNVEQLENNLASECKYKLLENSLKVAFKIKYMLII